MKFRRKFFRKDKVIGYFSLVYGVIFIVVDIFHYFIKTASDQAFYQSGEESILYLSCEPIDFKIVNWIFCVHLILAGVFLLKKNKIAWYLYQIAFIGIIFKPFLLLLGYPFIPSGLYIIHFILVIIGLGYTNSRLFNKALDSVISKKVLSYFSMFLLNLLIIGFLAFNHRYKPQNQMRKTLEKAMKNEISTKFYDTISHTNSLKDTCIFCQEFLNMLDTTNIEWKNIESFEIINMDENNEPIYSETAPTYGFAINHNYFEYDSLGLLRKEIKTNFQDENEINLYESYSNNFLKTKKRIFYLFVGYDTLIYKYNELNSNQFEEIVYRYQNQPFLKYLYTKNPKGLILKKEVINGYPGEGDIFYYYNNSGKKELVEEFNADGNIINREKYFYNNDRVVKKEEFFYSENRNILNNVFWLNPFWSYTSKYISFYRYNIAN